MAIIKCPECGQMISDKAKTCIHCGCPLVVEKIEGSITFRASSKFIGLFGKYNIWADNIKVAALKAGESITFKVEKETTYMVICGLVIGPVVPHNQIIALPTEKAKYSLSMYDSGRTIVSRVDVFDSID